MFYYIWRTSFVGQSISAAIQHFPKTLFCDSFADRACKFDYFAIKLCSLILQRTTTCILQIRQQNNRSDATTDQSHLLKLNPDVRRSFTLIVPWERNNSRSVRMWAVCLLWKLVFCNNHIERVTKPDAVLRLRRKQPIRVELAKPTTCSARSSPLWPPGVPVVQARLQIHSVNMNNLNIFIINAWYWSCFYTENDLLCVRGAFSGALRRFSPRCYKTCSSAHCWIGLSNKTRSFLFYEKKTTRSSDNELIPPQTDDSSCNMHTEVVFH